jgi:hypothetical protein
VKEFRGFPEESRMERETRPNSILNRQIEGAIALVSVIAIFAAVVIIFRV